jgi:hypothetical protein
LKLSKELKRLADKINKFPPTDPLFDRNFAFMINDCRQRLEKIIPIIHSFWDETWAFSIFQYVNEEIKKEKNSESMVPFKRKPGGESDVETLDEGGEFTGNFRKRTKKGIKKNLEDKNKIIDEYLKAVGQIDHQLKRVIAGYSQWRDEKSEFNNAVATRRKKMKPKLSEAAFRYGGGNIEI